MEPVRVLTAVAAPMVRANIDTDIIIPSREMKSVSKTGLSAGLFAGWRYLAIGSREPNPQFVLNQPAFANARIILGGENFGCGSSREHAVWALHEYGIRAVIAPSFSPIFFGNCVRNGIVPVVMPARSIEQLAAWVTADAQGNQLTVDLEHREVRGSGLRHAFEIAAEAREMLLEGLDAIDLTLKNRADIDAFHRLDRQMRPWIYLLPQVAETK
jgi:3-isopropylmalate/(R)-2-methylmalate dehydratase small subunit